MRGIAVLLVLFHHAGQLWTLPRAIHPLVWAGWSGVDLFFVLSGFLITGILLRGRTGPRPLTTFWARRALRIFPLAYLVLFLCFLASEAGAPGTRPIPGETWAWYALYGGNFHIMAHGWPPIAAMAVTWSLAIEEQFYFVWPLVVRFSPRWLIALVALGLAVLAPLARRWLFEDYGPMATVFTLARTDGLALGALLALALEAPRLRTFVRAGAHVLLAPALVATFALATERLGEPAWLRDYRLTLIAAGYTVLVAAAATALRPLERVLATRWLRWVGARSYGIYLFHYLVAPLYATLTAPWLDGGVASALGWVAVTFALSALSFALYEAPLLALRPALERRLGLRAGAR